MVIDGIKASAAKRIDGWVTGLDLLTIFFQLMMILAVLLLGFFPWLMVMV